MAQTAWLGALAALTTVAILLAACGRSTGGTTTTPTATTTRTPTEDAALATRVADSPAAKLGPALLSIADFPPDLSVKKQGAQIVAAGDVPGLASEASGFLATVATASDDEFVRLIAVAVDSDTGAANVLDALTPGSYLSGLTAGAPDAATSPLDVSSAPPGSKGFSFSGTVPASVTGQATGQSITGQALGFVRGSTYVLLFHGMLTPSARGIDVTKIAAAIDARLALSTVSPRPTAVAHQSSGAVFLPAIRPAMEVRVSVDPGVQGTWFWCIESSFGMPLADHFCATTGVSDTGPGELVRQTVLHVDPIWPSDAVYFIRMYCEGDCVWHVNASPVQ